MTSKAHDPKTLPDPGRWPAYLTRLDLDAETLELIMAALTTDVCDDIDDLAAKDA